LFVADTGFDRVLIWNDIADALAGKSADVILGASDFQDTSPQIGADKLFWPCTLAFDGSYLWVGEFKFSERILRFSVRRGIRHFNIGPAENFPPVFLSTGCSLSCY